MAFPRSLRKGRDSFSLAKVEYQAVGVFHGEMRALKDSGVDEQCPRADNSSLALYDGRSSSCKNKVDKVA